LNAEFQTLHFSSKLNVRSVMEIYRSYQVLFEFFFSVSLLLRASVFYLIFGGNVSNHNYHHFSLLLGGSPKKRKGKGKRNNKIKELVTPER